MNFDKFNAHIRKSVSASRSWLHTDVICQLIEMAVGERFNQSAALVMRATLKASEARQKSVSDARSGKIH